MCTGCYNYTTISISNNNNKQNLIILILRALYTNFEYPWYPQYKHKNISKIHTKLQSIQL